MNRQQISAQFDRFLRLQGLCGAIIVASWLIFWAVENPVSNVRDLFLYVLTQMNLTVLLLHPLKVLYEDRRARYHWPIHVIAILAVNCVVVVASAAVIYRVDGLNQPFLAFLRHSWKFPFVANLVFAFAYETYKVTTRSLRSRNQQLQRRIDADGAEREIEAQELRQALEIQRGLLPKEIPQLPGFAITGAWEPARVVGGDYYDVIRLGPEKIGICIADVAGKGISAALLMANVQAAVRAFASETVSPSRVCSQINSVLCTNIAPGKFVTLFYGVLDAGSRTLQFTNAGHLRPLLIREGAPAQHLENDGALLGVFPEWSYEDSTVEVRTGDLLLLFTDGITEAMRQDGEEFGEERLSHAITKGEPRALEELQSDVLQRVKQFCDSRLNDDATLVMVSAPAAGAREFALNRNLKEQVLQHAGVSS
ncbi:MAG TPA: PP2C family protein-serine/threonine phosphatase [Terriglobales bacterium]